MVCPSGWRQCCASILIVACAAGPAAARESVAPLEFAAAQTLALSRAPALQAARSEAQAARDMAVAAGQLPDPVLKLGVSNLPISGEMAWSLTREPMTMRNVGVMQELTRSATREAASARGEAEAAMAQARQRMLVRQVRGEVAQAWLEVALLSRMREQLIAAQRQAKRQSEASEAALRGGRGSQQDWLAARNTEAGLAEQLIEMDGELAMARARLARWVGDAAEGPLGSLPDTRRLRWQDEDPTSHDTLAPAAAEVSLAQAELRLARERSTPDWAVEAMYARRGSAFGDMVSITFSRPLSWDRANRQDRDVAARVAQLERARAAQDDMQREYSAMLAGRLASWRAARDRASQLAAVRVPLSRDTVQAALAAYAGGMGTLPMLLEAQRMEIETQMAQTRAELELARAWAAVNFLGGVDDVAVQ